MKNSSFEKYLTQNLEKSLIGVTPGVQIMVYSKGKKIAEVEAGETFPYYDLASLTKIIFTVPMMMKSFEEKKWNLKTTVSSILPWFPHSQVLISELLSHSGGLPWWLPIYEKLNTQDSILNKWYKTAEIIRAVNLENTGKTVYSDLDFWVLGFILEAFYEKPLSQIWVEYKSDFFDNSTLNFHLENKSLFNSSKYAPTERCPWRKKLLQGEVHDDNCWALGGVCSHAGLFGSLDDLAWYGLFIRSHLHGHSKLKLKPQTVKLFAKRAIPEERGDWSLGFMMPSKGGSSSGKYFSADSIGHTGFTGTSLWFDPHQDLLIATLSNRVLYGRDKKDFANLRPQMHNWVVEGLRKA